MAGFRDLAGFLQGYQVDPSAYQQRVLGGEFLGNNPHQDAMIQRLRDSYTDSLGEIDSRFAGAGRFGSGALGRAHVLANDRFNTGVGSLLGQLWEGERGRMNEVQGMLSQENIGARNNISGFAGILKQVAGAIKQANIAAAAQRYGVDAQRAMGMANLDRLRDNDAFNRLATTFGIANTMNQGNIRQEFLPIELLQGFSSTTLPILQGFGTTHTTQTGSGANVNPWAAGVTQGLGGALTGASVGNQMGGKG